MKGVRRIISTAMPIAIIREGKLQFFLSFDDTYAPYWSCSMTVEATGKEFPLSHSDAPASPKVLFVINFDPVLF